MQKPVAFFSVAVTVGAVVFGAAACEESSESTFPTAEEDAAVEASGPGFIPPPPDGSPGDEPLPVDCKPSLPTTFEPTWNPPTKMEVCEPEELTAYYDACVAASDPDAGDACKAWKDAHADCAGCLEPPDNNGPIQFFLERRFYGLNVAGCLAIVREEPEAGKCPAAYAAAIECQRVSCDDCLLQSGAQYSDFQKCQQAARETGCERYEKDVRSACPAGFTGPDGGAYACFRPKDEDERTHFVRVEGIFCGK